jgi:hypothetical protein
MKNYLVGAVRPVSTTWGYWKTQEQETVALREHNKYDDMYRLSRASARQFLQGNWEEIKFSAPVLDARLYQIAQWYVIKELWFREPCNILAMGADTLFMKPTEVFGRYPHMMMFNYTDPRQHAEFPHYFNDDIRYYPADMDPNVWNIGERAMQGWFDHTERGWAWGQLIHNYQFWSQGLAVDQVLDPTMAWQAFALSQDLGEQWNNCAIKDAKILHFHGSRGSDQRVAVMTDLCRQLKINTQEETK